MVFKFDDTPLPNEGQPDPSRQVGNVRFTDADTLVNQKTGQSYRASNLSAPETAHFKNDIFVPPQIGGDETHAGIADLVGQLPAGTNLTGAVTGKSFNREVAPFTFADTAYRAGIVRPDRHATPEQAKAATEGYIGRTLLPEFSAADPIQQIGQRTRASIAQAAAKERVPQYISPVEFRNEADRAAYNQYRSNTGIADDGVLIHEYQNQLDSDLFDPQEKAEIQNKINILKAQTFSRASMPDIASDTVTFRSAGDRTLDNQARDQFSTTWNKTWSEFGSGIIDLAKGVGEKGGWEALERNADAWSWNRKYDTNKMASTLSSFKDVTDSKGFWNTTSNAMTYLGNLATQTSVYALAAAPGVLIEAPLAAFAVGAAPMFLTTAGQIYDTQPENSKNLGMALATSAVVSSLEQIGLHYMFRGSNGILKPNVADAIMSKAGRESMANFMVKSGKAATADEALQLIEKATKRGLTNFAENAAHFASQQNNLARNAARMGGRTAIGLTEEGATEGLQEGFQIYGETGDWNKYKAPLDPQYRERLKEATIGGAALGGPIGGVRGAHSAMQWWGVEDLQRPADPTRQADYVQFQGMQRSKQGTAEPFQQTSIDQALNTYQGSSVPKTLDGKNIGDTKLSSIYGEGQSNWLTRAKEIVKDPISFFRGQAGSAIRSAFSDDGTLRTHLPSLWSMISDRGYLSGAHEERHEKDLQARWAHGLNLGNLAGELGTNEQTAGEMIKQTVAEGVDENTHPAIKNWLENAERSRRDMYYESVENGVNPNHLTDLETMLDVIATREDVSGSIQRNISKITDELSTESGKAPVSSPGGQVLNTANNILKLLKAFTSKDRTVSAAAAMDLKKIGALDSPAFKDATDYNIVDNINRFIQGKAKEISLQRYYGKDGEKIGKIILHSYHDGEITADQARETAYIIDRMLKQRQGNFYDMSEFKTLDTMMSLTTTAMLGALLGKVAITSQIEVAMASLGIPQDKLQTYMGQYLSAIKDNLREDLNWVKVASAARMGVTLARRTASSAIIANAEAAMAVIDDPESHTPKEIGEAIDTLKTIVNKAQPRQLADALGFLHTGSAHNQQVSNDPKSKLSHINRKMMGIFQLTNVTDATRIAVLSAIPDMIREKLSVLSMIPPRVRDQYLISGRGLTKEQAEAYRELTQAGLDVFGHLKYMESNDNVPMDYSDLINEEVINEDLDAPTDRELLRRNMMTTLANIVNKHVVEPEVQSTPVGFGNPWLRPLTTLKRFVWASYNTFIPRLYKDFVANGNVSMRYDAFATMAATYIMAELTNSMKDLVSWGDTDKHDKKLGFYKKIQRNIYSSGLLGPVGPAADTLFPVFNDPLYGIFKKDKKGISPSALDIANNIAKEHSPMYGYVAGPVGGIIDAAEGNTDKAEKALLKATPLNAMPGLINSLVKTMK